MMNLAHARRLLDVDAACTPDDARQNYRDLVRVWHPDRFETDPRLRAKAEQRLAQITEAYRFLEQYGDRAAEPAVIRVQTPVAVVTSPRRSWMGHVAVALVVLAAMALVAMPRRNALVASAPAFVEAPAATPAPAAARAVVPAPARTPAVVRASASRSFIARETDAVLSRK